MLRGFAALLLAAALLGLGLLPTVVQPCGHHVVHREVSELVAMHTSRRTGYMSVGGAGSAAKGLGLGRTGATGGSQQEYDELVGGVAGDVGDDGDNHNHHEDQHHSHDGESLAAEVQVQQEGEVGEAGSAAAAAGGGPHRTLAEASVPGPAPLRISVSYQRLESLAYTDTTRLTRIVEAVRRILQKFIMVKRPVSGGLLADPFCNRTNSRGCLEYVPDMTNPLRSTCGAATISLAHVVRPSSCSRRVDIDTAVGLWRGNGGPASGAGNGASAYGTGCSSFAGTKGEATDMYLYITAANNEDCAAGAAAWALPCVLDMGNKRPLISAANVCPGALRLLDEEALTAVLVHEMVHALGFTDTMFDLTRHPDGSPRDPSSVLETQTLADGSSVSRLVTPNVVEAARAHFGCPTLSGAQLEDEGTQGSAGSHWEYNHYQGEVMVASTIFAADGSPAALSNLTLAYLDDTGWYVTNRSAAGRLAWGAGAGCGLPNGKTCGDLQAAAPRLFCDPNAAAARDGTPVFRCTSSYKARGVCRTLNFTGGCGLLLSNNAEETCTVPGLAANDRPDVFGWGTGSPSGRCLPVVYKFQVAVNAFTTYIYPSTSRDNDADAACFNTFCSADGTRLFVRLLNQTLECPEGKSLELARLVPGYRDGTIGPCPPAAALCSTQSCPAAVCNPTGGDCSNGACYCRLAYTGSGCSTNLITGQSVPNVDGGGGGTTPKQSVQLVLQLIMSMYNTPADVTSRGAQLQRVLANWADLDVSRVRVNTSSPAPSSASGLQAGDPYDATGSGRRRRGVLQAASPPPAAARSVVTAFLAPSDDGGVAVLSAQVRDSAQRQLLLTSLDAAGFQVVPGSLNASWFATKVDGDNIKSTGGSTADNYGGSSSSTGRTAMIIGIVVAACVLAGVLAAVVTVAVMRRRRATHHAAQQRAQTYAMQGFNGNGGGVGIGVPMAVYDTAGATTNPLAGGTPPYAAAPPTAMPYGAAPGQEYPVMGQGASVWTANGAPPPPPQSPPPAPEAAAYSYYSARAAALAQPPPPTGQR